MTAEQLTAAAVIASMADFLQGEHDSQQAVMGDEFVSVELDPEQVRRLIVNLRGASSWFERAGL